MATLKEHIYAVKNILNKGIASDDSRFSNRLIAHYLKQSRGLLLKRKLDKDKYISTLNYQRICVPLELVTYGDCECISDVFANCKILRSTCTFPSVFTSKSRPVLSVKAIDGTVLSQTSITKDKLKAYSLSQQNPKLGWFIENNRLYVLHSQTTPLVIAVALWEDPEEVSDFCTCGDAGNSNTPCYNSQEDEFPIDIDLVLPMYEMTLQMFGLGMQYPEDNENNARSNQIVNDAE